MLFIPPVYSPPVAALSATVGGALDAYTTGLTGAWSMGRKLLNGYGGSFYAATGSLVDTVNDQSGASRNLTAGGGASRPSVTTVGSNAAADFVLNTSTLTGAAISNFFANNAGFIVWVGVLDSNNGTFSRLVHDNVQEVIGILSITSTVRVSVYNWDGSNDQATGAATALSTGSPHVVTWRHEGGTLYGTVDGGSEVSIASGNTTAMTGAFQFGATSTGFDGKLIEAYVWSTIPSSGDRTAIINQAKTYVGI